MANAATAGMQALERLVGSWEISGGTTGKTTYEWMDGGFFLIQRGEVEREGQEFTYMQIIGYDRSPEGELADAITGRLYTSNGDTLLYTCEPDDKGLTIWFGEKGSSAVYRGEWSDDGNTLEGEWKWAGGGYNETMTRVSRV